MERSKLFTLKTIAIAAIAGFIASTTVVAHAGASPKFPKQAQRTAAVRAAQQQGVSHARMERQRLAWQAKTTKRAAGLALEREARRIENLIDTLERGEAVDPAALDRATDQLR